MATHYNAADVRIYIGGVEIRGFDQVLEEPAPATRIPPCSVTLRLTYAPGHYRGWYIALRPDQGDDIAAILGGDA
jgi:hypothetical protein